MSERSVRLENARLEGLMIGLWGHWGYHVTPMGPDLQRGRRGPCASRLHQMRSDLGRLDAIAEILQVRPFLGRRPARLAARSARWYIAAKMQGASHENFARGGMRWRWFAGGCCGGLTALACAQIAQYQFARGSASKTPEEKEAEEAQGQGLQGIAEENPRRQGLVRSLGHACAARRGEDTGCQDTPRPSRRPRPAATAN